MTRKNNSTRKFKPKNEFRRNQSPSACGHFDYVFGETKTQFKSLGLTHSPTKGRRYYPLRKNPNPNDSKQSFLQLNVRGTNKKYFKAPEKDFKFAKEDMPIVRHTIKQYKKSTNRKSKNWYFEKRRKKRAGRS